VKLICCIVGLVAWRDSMISSFKEILEDLFRLSLAKIPGGDESGSVHKFSCICSPDFILRNRMQLKLKQKILGGFLLVGLLPLTLLGVLMLDQASTALEQQAYSSLEAVRESRKGAIHDYFSTMNSQLIALSQDAEVVTAMSQFVEAFPRYHQQQLSNISVEQQRSELNEYYTHEFGTLYRQRNGHTFAATGQTLSRLNNNAIALQHAYIIQNPHPLGKKQQLDLMDDNSDYSQIHQRLHPLLRNHQQHFGYYDVFLVDAISGEIVYSVFKEIDYATSLQDGPFAQSAIGKAFHAANQLSSSAQVAFADFSPYLPSFDEPAGFIASPVFDGDKKVGVLIFQLPIDRITEVMSNTAGLGESGETILVGPDYLMRSDSRLEKRYHSVIHSFQYPEQGKVDTVATRAVLKLQQSGRGKIFDYRQQEVIVSYTPLEMSTGISYALIAKKDVAEAFSAVTALGNLMLLLGIGAILIIVGVAFSLSRSITSPIFALRDVAASIGAGNLQVQIEIKQDDEIGDLATSLQHMADSLATAQQESDRHAWIDNGVAAINSVMRGERSEQELAAEVIEQLCRGSEASIGLLYLRNGEELRPYGRYGYTPDNSHANHYRLGESIVGQAAEQAKTIHLSNIPKGYLKISSSLGATTPKHIQVIPFLFEQSVVGVIELGSIEALSEDAMEVVDRSLESIGIAFQAAISRSKLKQQAPNIEI